MTMVQSTGRAMASSCVDVWSTMLDRDEKRRMKDETSESVRARIQYLMRRERLTTAEQLAQFVGVSKGTGYNWLTPGKLPSVVEFRIIARKFRVSTEWLYGDEPLETATESGAEAAAAPDVRKVAFAAAKAAAQGATATARKQAAAKKQAS